METHKCSVCNEDHVVRRQHKEILNKLKLVMLKRAAEHVIRTMDNNFMVRDISEPEEYSVFHNFQKLRYHGLTTPMRDAAGKRMKGSWLITRNGWAFLRGEIELPKYVMISENTIKSRSEELVTLRQVDASQFEIQTQFEYFDEANNPIGLRPSTPVQTSLI